MTYSISSFLLLIAFVCGACSDSSTNDGNTIDTTSDSVAKKVSIDTVRSQDTVVKSENSVPGLRDVSDWKLQDFIVDGNNYPNEEISSTIEYELEQVKNLKSPFVAKYMSCEILDYFHLNFVDSTGRVIDFGNGENNLGEYILYSSPDFIESPRYAGKTFLVYWNWEVASFPCCSGSYNIVKAYVPTITKLELQENNTGNK